MHAPDPAPEGTMDTSRTALTVMAVIVISTLGFYLVCLGIPPDAPPAPKPVIMAVTITCGDVASPTVCGMDLPPVGSNADYGVCRADGFVHSGTDIPILVGDFVRSMEAGIVVEQAQSLNGMGGYVRVLQADGLEATYTEVVPIVCEGDLVEVGEIIGRAGILHDQSIDDSPGVLHIGLAYYSSDGTAIQVDPRPFLEYINRCDDELVEPEADTDSGPDASAAMP